MTERSVRNLLLQLGIGSFQATMVVPNMFQAPAVSDPKSPHVMLVVGALQDRLNQMGAGIARTGYLDDPTAAVLERVVGTGWERRSWSDVIARVLSQQRVPGAYVTADRARAPVTPDKVSFADVPFGLPEVPGGLATYAVGGFLLWRFLKKRKG